MICKECDVLPLAPKRVRFSHWWGCHKTGVKWGVGTVVLVLLIIGIISFIVAKKREAQEKLAQENDLKKEKKSKQGGQNGKQP